MVCLAHSVKLIFELSLFNLIVIRVWTVVECKSRALKFIIENTQNTVILWSPVFSHPGCTPILQGRPTPAK